MRLRPAEDLRRAAGPATLASALLAVSILAAVAATAGDVDDSGAAAGPAADAAASAPDSAPDSGAGLDTAERARRLEALGYIDVIEEGASGDSAAEAADEAGRAPGAGSSTGGAVADSRYGVVLYDRERSWPGLNLYTPCGGTRFGIESWRGARIFDMEGRSLHEWRSDFVPAAGSVWSMARMDARGMLYGVYSEQALLKLDWTGKPLWITRGRFHHDISLDADGTVLALLMRDVAVEAGDQHWTIKSHGVAFVDPADGTVRRTLWLDETLAGQNFWRQHLQRLAGRRDVMHANTVRASPVAVEGLWEAGDLVVSARHLDRILVVDRDDGALRWQWGAGVVQGQHDPHVLADGTILVFDNGVDRKRSRILRVDPRDGRIVWSYGEGPDQRFFSPGRGLVERLPNGNVLVTSSAEARAFEVDAAGRKVWEYRAPPEPGQSQRLPFRMTRLPWPRIEDIPGPVAVASPAQPPARSTDASSTSSNVAPRSPASSR